MELVSDLDPVFSIARIEGGGDLALEGAVEPKLPKCEVRIYIGGKPGISFQHPNGLFKEVRFQLYSGLYAKAWIFEKKYEHVFVKFCLPSENCAGSRLYAIPLHTGAPELGFRPVSRDYLKDGPPRFVAHDDSRKLSAFRDVARFGLMGRDLCSKDDTRGEGIVDLTLMEGEYPYGEPSLAGSGEELMLLYVSGAGDGGDYQFTDINWMHFNGVSWTEAAPINADTLGEFNPQVAFDGSGNAVAVWERIKDPDFDEADLEGLAALLEIVWSRWDAASGAWSEPAAITDNDHLDYSPLLAGPMADGSLLLTWMSNEASMLMGEGPPGDPANDTVFWARWDPVLGDWSTPAVLLDGLAYNLTQSLSGAGNKAVYVWTRDEDGDLEDDTDQEVYYIEYDGATWGAPVRLTDDLLADRNAKVAVSPAGDFYIVWQSGEALVMDVNGSGAATVVREESSTIDLADFALTVGPQGNVVLIWEGMNEDGSNPFCRVYDPVSGGWSQDIQLLANPYVEKSFSPVWDAAGNLTVAYNRVHIDKVTKLVDTEEGLFEVENVPEPGQVDVAVFQRALVIDAGILDGDFTAEGANYRPFDEVVLSATVRNLGDLALENLQVAFFDGDPDLGGVEIGTRQTVTGWLDGGETQVVSTAWTVPEPARARTLFAVVDPDGLISEFTTANNRVSLSVGGPDLALQIFARETFLDGSARIVTDVRNVGTEATVATTLAVRYEGGTTPLDTAVIPALAAGRASQVAVNLPPGSVPPSGVMIEITADDGGLTGDVYEANNVVTFHLLGPLVEGSLRVDIEPVDAVDDGAMWRRVGTSTWLPGGTTEPGLTPGDYTVEFLPVAGWDTPAERVVAVGLYGTAVSTGLYVANGSVYQITVGAATPGGAVLGAGPYLHNALVTLTAVPERGYRFFYWMENGEIVSTESTLTFLATEERELEAHFARAGTMLPGVMMLLLEE